MNILYIAISCSPYEGSEAKIGWNIPKESAEKNRVFVITMEKNKADIEGYLSREPLGNIRFYYVDIPDICKKIYRGAFFSGQLIVWSKRALKTAQKVCREEKIDLIHQITPVEFRSIGDYGKIPGVKFVCGPIAGGQRIPDGLKEYVRAHRMVEGIRSCINSWCRFLFRVNGKLKKCDRLLFANYETKAFLRGMVSPEQSGGILTDVSVDDRDLVRLEEARSRDESACRFLVVGRMVYLKGHALLLDALARLPKELGFACRIVGDGPEMEPLKKACVEKGLAHHVTFAGAVPYAQVAGEYENADVLVMPSFREATGSVLLEAMAKGLPVVTIDQFGGAAIVDEDCGWLYEGQDQESYIENLKNALLECIQRPDEVCRRGRNARIRAEQYTWKQRMKYYQEIYEEVLGAE